MTGHAHLQTGLDDGIFVVELRSVNSRFTDIAVRLPDEWRGLEPVLRERIAAHVHRGKVECRVQWKPLARRSTAIVLDEERVAALLALGRRLREQDPALRAWSVAELLAFDGVLNPAGNARSGPDAIECNQPEAAAPSADAANDPWLAVREPVESAFQAFVQMREREGLRLRNIIEGQLQGIETQVARLRPVVPALIDQARERLEKRLREALPPDSSVPPEETLARVRQEVALLSLRADVVEELDRLQSHVVEARRTLQRGGAVGKRLDFLAQEMNREANTVGSKAIGLVVSEAGLALKLLIEQIREQAQNLE